MSVSKVCLFDIDGTLISTGGAGRAALEAALELAFGLPPDTSMVSLGGRTDRAIATELFALYDIVPTTQNWQRFIAAYLQSLPRLLAARSGRVLPGVAALLARLASEPRVAVGLLTGNVRQGAQIKLSHYEIESHFAFGGFGDEHVERCDVAASALRAAREHLWPELRPEDVWVIGDTIHDVACGRSIGAKVMALPTGSSTRNELAASGPDLLFDDLSLEHAQSLDWL